MSNLATLIEQALAPKEASDIMEDATEEQLRAGRGIRPRDMTREEREERSRAMQRRRARQYRKRQERATDNAHKDTATVPQQSVRDALDITAHLSAKIDLVAQRRARKASRLLGSLAEDCTFETFAAVNRSIAGAIHREERDREEVRAAAEWLSHEPGIPSISKYDDEVPAHAGWLMSVIEYRSRTALQSWYDKNPSIESLAHGDSSLSHTHQDDYYDHFCASRSPGLVGARWPQPGQIDPSLTQAVIAGAITERGLDGLVELVLANLRSDGSFPWTEHGEAVFLTLGLDMHWHLLCRKVESPELRGRYAREVARRALSFILPAMKEATSLMERGYWSPPDPEQVQAQALLPDPQEQARVVIDTLEAVSEALA